MAKKFELTAEFVTNIFGKKCRKRTGTANMRRNT